LTDTDRLSAFQAALRFPTVSTQSGSDDPAPFIGLHAQLRRSFPLVHLGLAQETVSGGSLLFTWRGSSPSEAPILLTAHLDVVPEGDPSSWRFPPFSGALADGIVWGRGALDYKVGVTGMLQACEDLLAEGFQPVRDLCLAFGHDEEVGGLEGAARISALLESRGMKFSSVLDEGGYLYSYPWLTGEVAVVGLAEKGYLTLRLTGIGEQGHASSPPLSTPCGRLGRCLHLLEERQMPARLCGPVRSLLSGTGHLFGRELQDHSQGQAAMASALECWPSGNALVRTTTAPTILAGGCKENILPAEVHAIVNFRPVPGDRIEDVLTHVRGIAAPLGVEVSIEDARRAFEPSGESTLDTPDGRALLDAIESTWPGITAVPGIFPAATDSRHYSKVADQVYRFVPVPLGPAGLGALHAAGESLSGEDYLRAVRFYRSYIARTSRMASREAG
jgi:carboxypeptidase PM20D1